MTPDFSVILPAAGSGSRFGASGGGGDKLLVDLAGQTVLQRSISLFAKRPDVAQLLIVTAKDRFEPYRAHLATHIAAKKLIFVEGGRERWESVLFGLRKLKESPTPYVAVHDAARPLTPGSVIDHAFGKTREMGAALPCLPEPATLKRRGPDGNVSETVDRSTLFQAQTPQCFTFTKLLAAYEQLLAANQMEKLTDDAQIFERVGHPVAITPGSPINLKITTAEDTHLANALLSTP